MFIDKEEMFVLILRVDFLEMENKKLGNKIVHTSNQLAVLERTLQNMQSLHFAEVLRTVKPALSLYRGGDLELLLFVLL